MSISYIPSYDPFGVRIRRYTAMDFVDRAACRAYPTNMFFPEADTPPAEILMAFKICQSCPVRTECLEWALENREKYGIYGGVYAGRREKGRNRGLTPQMIMDKADASLQPRPTQDRKRKDPVPRVFDNSATPYVRGKSKSTGGGMVVHHSTCRSVTSRHEPWDWAAMKTPMELAVDILGREDLQDNRPCSYCFGCTKWEEMLAV